MIKPILFNGSMVRTILAGQKTQTRRVIDFMQIAKQTGCTRGRLAWSTLLEGWAVFDGNGDADLCEVKAPYAVGDVLWVRETWAEIAGGGSAVYRATAERDEWEIGPSAKWCPSIHMPKWACRLWLRVVDVRVERLQDITEADAVAEGVSIECRVDPKDCTMDVCQRENGCPLLNYIGGFAVLWDDLAKSGVRWADNPWVWVIQFERCEKPEGWPHA
ncbi:hypothetical protein ACI3L3_11795 [Desulfobaculum sp. SPO524]|uniref:hypothetical protein n=1 Tax=Desulfobaculum sp. SPO524 TaxID=3378071 RepID=UPI0038518EE4